MDVDDERTGVPCTMPAVRRDRGREAGGLGKRNRQPGAMRTKQKKSNMGNERMREDVRKGNKAMLTFHVRRDRRCRASMGAFPQDEIQREAKTMKNVNHPNLLPLHCCFVAGVKLWMVMPYVAAGSLLHIMKWSYPEGLDEVFIATVLREVLKGLEYLHKNGMIHRDIKAGNILIDANGQVKLADFGVSATIERTGTWGGDGSRFTFVGTPCWMAPEVMDAEVGYDFHADIWSFGITILELAHGHAPFARYPPMKVLMMTLQNPPPTLQEAENKTFSKALRELVALCLQKDPMKRPTAAKLLEHRFFKGAAKGPDYLVKYLLADLPSLSERVKAMRNKDHPGFKKQAQKEAEPPKTKVEEGWNFDVADSKGRGSNPASETPEAVTPKEPQRTEGKDANKAAVHMEATAESPSGSARRKTVGSESAGGLRTGRTFKVLEADDEDDEISSAGRVFQRQPSLQKTMSQPVMAALDRSSGMSTSSTAALVPALQHMLVHAVQQEKLVKQLLASLDVHDTAKVISQTKSVPHLEDLDHPNPTMAAIAEVQNQVAQLMSDMQVLRERNQHLARKVNMLSSERDVGQKGKEEEER